MNKNEYIEGIPLEDFISAYYECRRHKRRTVNQMKFELNYESNLVKLWKEVNERTYEIGKSICFCVTRPKIREVFAADFRDRIIHHVIMQRLNPLFEKEFIEDNYNCRVGKGTLYGLKRLNDKLNTVTENYTKDAWIGKFDIKGFFMSINKPLLLKRLNVFIDEKYSGNDKELLLWLVEKVVMNEPQDNCIIKCSKEMWDSLPKNKSLFTCGENNGLPIGNLTSQIFGNFYLNEFDKWMYREFDGNYGRYVDDFYVLSKDKEKILNIVPNIAEYMKTCLNVELHDDKIYIQPSYHGVTFIGSIIKKGRIYIGNRTVSNMIDLITSFNSKVSKENARKFCQALNSYIGFMKHNCSYAIKRSIFNMINPEWWNYVKIVGDFNHIQPICL